ncbi:Ktr system potassium uptake protein B [Novipirellula aureliae]|uniref:Ktr system potassium uptake protein B n=1 Tax=Novipirellula aureliae TaxID=2527966 RepID=A0A5C6DQC4_9BACT|nr:TrkH family potassium uptake protein [Novipirellula aureliae]TWU39030.1 Ktr system potassium uptake protein B [Novipirellula aureliae]
MKKRLTQHRTQYRTQNRWDSAIEGNPNAWRRISPPRLFVGSFVILIAIGTLGFLYLPGIHADKPLSFSDSLFMATSAVCVTGLSVVDTSTQFTFRGQAFLLLLIQLGGLGMLAFTSLVIQVLGFRLTIGTESLTYEPRRGGPRVNLRRLTRDVILYTFIFEAIGAVALLSVWGPRSGFEQAWWPAIFHSVSAFCNAGFSTFGDSLVGLRDSPLTILILSVLIVAGGLGFVTMEESWLCYRAHRRQAKKNKRKRRMSLHSQLVLITSGLLILVPWPMFAFFEWNNTLVDFSLIDKISNSFFLSITPRTAGFNSIDYAAASDSTNFLTILLMTIGGSPGSTAGGMKTTTFALILLLAWSRIRGNETTVFRNRSIPEDTTQRAIGLAVVAGVLMAMSVFALAISDGTPNPHGGFLARMFEAVSAFNTVGLSMNLTQALSFSGRLVTIAMMFVGRVGPLMLASALVIGRGRRGRFRYAYEDVAVG